MKNFLRPAAVLAAALIALGSLAACGSNTNPAQPAVTSSAVTVLPVTSNPMPTTGTKPGLAITNAIAENNVNPTTKAPWQTGCSSISQTHPRHRWRAWPCTTR